MERLYGSAHLMIVSDLDQTMVDHNDSENVSLLRFNALWESEFRQDSVLVFSTGRSPVSYKKLQKKRPLLTPDITVMSVGTEITYGESLIPDDDWKQFLDKNWNRNIVTEETSKFPELIPQEEINQRPHKISFYLEKASASRVMKDLLERLEKRGLDAKIIYSSGVALDVLPRGAGKGEASAYLLKKFEINVQRLLVLLFVVTLGMMPNFSLFLKYTAWCLDAYEINIADPLIKQVRIALEELLHWYEENAKNNPNIIHSTERCAAGIVQAIANFNLGSSVSPRDAVGFSEFEIKNVSPNHEIVMFYLFYEIWRRAELEKDEQSIHKLRSICNSMAIFVHPSGIKQPLHQSIDAMISLHGDKQGKQFQVWVDRISSTEIASNTWLMRFDKWESSGEDKHCCLTTVLLCIKSEEADRLTWLHLHQTWLEGQGAEDPSTWLF